MTGVQPMPAADRLYAERVNPQWVRLLNLLEMNVRYERCVGAELFTSDGRRILDFLSGYCVHNAGHNHPRIIASLKEELDRCGPAMLQSHAPELAARLAYHLTQRAGGRLRRAVFCSSGSEGVETAIKFARAYTRRSKLLYAQGAFHGLTCGALSLMSNPFWTEGFGPMLPGATGVPFGSVQALEDCLATRQFAAFIVEPIQAEGGIQVPPPGYLQTAQQLCRRYGTVFVLDEVQTGMYRTGPFLAAHHFGLDPDIVILAKALSGGLVPVGAVLTTEAIANAVYASLKRALVHASTYGENGLAMRAGLAALEVMEAESLGPRAETLGSQLRKQLRETLAPYELVKEVRGMGMLSGIEFTAPRRLSLRAAYEGFDRLHPAMFSQVLVMHLFRNHDILTQACGNNFKVLKVAPPLVVSQDHLAHFVASIHETIAFASTSPRFWSEALRMARRATNI